ncbi:MAG: U32 family peptidase [Bacilli bacterium]|nr:U32 family peptidase [Bacilli bacterium]
MKHELLAPAGDMESLYQAIHNGADAIYVGLKQFGARHYAKNFSNEEMKHAIYLCHLYGVRLYATMNTLIKDGEVSSFLKTIEFLHKEGIDAVIMQDFGMICLVREMFPNLEIHASTQANNSSIETIQLLSDLGVKRVVLSREMSLDEINQISVNIEKEIFIHGALCISYSGNCYMSSVLGGRSGNRGECVGNCRLKYDLEQNGKIILKDQYLLSTKELNTSSKFQDLLNSDIQSFKIEGRMKSPEYVGFITRFYRRLIDGENFSIAEEMEKLRVLFNRDFTTGNLFCDKRMMNPTFSNHIGLPIGKVVRVTKKYIMIRLNKEINQEDGIRFLESGKGFIVNYLYDESKNLISSSSGTVIVDNKVGLTTLDHVYKTIDKKLIKSLKNFSPRKIAVQFFITAKKNQKLRIAVYDGVHKVEEEKGIVEIAVTSSISKDRIKKQVEKLGNTPFFSTNVEIDMDRDVFVSIKELNELRRTVIEKLTQIRGDERKLFLKRKVSFPKINTNTHNDLTASVTNCSQLKTCLQLGFQRIYVNDLALYHQYKDRKEVYYQLDRNLFQIDEALQEKNIVGENILFSNYSNTYGSYFLNITNSYSAYYLLKNGLPVIPVSIELNEYEIQRMVQNFQKKFSCSLPLEIMVYGRVCNMVIKNNPLSLNSQFRYRLIDYKKRCFPILYKNGKTYILNHITSCTSYSFPFPYTKQFNFYDETSEEIICIVKKLK